MAAPAPNQGSILLRLVSIFDRTIGEYHIFTVAVIAILDILGTAPDVAFWGLSALTLGSAVPLTLSMWGILDVGLMFIGAVLTFILEFLRGKGLGTAVGLSILSAAFLMVPGPLFTVAVLGSMGLIGGMRKAKMLPEKAL